MHGESNVHFKYYKNRNSLFPCVLVTRVFPMFLTANMAGAFTSYQSFFVKGSTLGGKKGRKGRKGREK